MSSINLVKENDIEAIIRCPYKLSEEHNWKHAVQSIINTVIIKYDQLPKEEQTYLSILELIEKYWKNIDVHLFKSTVDYYVVLAKITNHLLQNIKVTEGENRYEKLPFYLKQVNKELSVIIEHEPTTHSFTIRKYLVEADEQLIMCYRSLLLVFLYTSLGKLPERVDIISLLDGRLDSFSPTMADFVEGVEAVKNMLKFNSYKTSHFYIQQKALNNKNRKWFLKM